MTLMYLVLVEELEQPRQPVAAGELGHQRKARERQARPVRACGCGRVVCGPVLCILCVSCVVCPVLCVLCVSGIKTICIGPAVIPRLMVD